MKLVTFTAVRARASAHPSNGHLETALHSLDRPRGERIGALAAGSSASAGPRTESVVDLNRALVVKLLLEDSGAPEAEANSLLPPHMMEFLLNGAPALAIAERTLAWVMEALETWEPGDLAEAEIVLPARGLALGPPVPRPGKILAVGRNYVAHSQERGQATPPTEPVLFHKPSSAVIGPDAPIRLPRSSSEVDYEGELALVVGRPCSMVREEDALDHLVGYTIGNDVSARDYQNVRGQHFIGKSFDTFAPLGPALVTRDHVTDPQDLSLRTMVNGEVRQEARTKEMIFGAAQIIAFASRIMTLEPGDVILTGTPAGVGAALDPPRFLASGDVVEIEIESLGTLRNHVVRGYGAGDDGGGE